MNGPAQGVSPPLPGALIRSRLFDALSGGDWRLQGRSEGGSQLLLRIPTG